MPTNLYKVFPHNPPHLFLPGAFYMVTAATYQKLPHLAADARKEQLLESLVFKLDEKNWQLLAFVILHNHYHILLQAPSQGAQALSAMIADVHKFIARRWNEADHARARSVWWNYWDTCLTSERAFFARVNYVHWNPVKHGCASAPEAYAFSSHRMWQERSHDELQRIERDYPFDRVKAFDDF